MRGQHEINKRRTKNKKLGVVLVREGREGDGAELSAFKPVNCGCVNGNSLLCSHVGPVFQIMVLPLLFGLKPQTCQPAEVLLAHSFVNGGATAYTLSVVVRHRRPPVRFALDKSQNHILNWRWQPGDLPRDVGLPASPSLRKVLLYIVQFTLVGQLQKLQ